MNREVRDSNSKVSLPKSDNFFTIDDALIYVKRLLRPLGVWTIVNPNPSKIEQKLAILIRPFAIFLMILVIFLMFSEVAVQRASREELIGLMAPITYQSSNTIKHFFMMFRTDAMKKCIKHMKMDWDTIDSLEDREILTRNIKKAKKMALYTTVTYYAGSTLYNFVLPALAESYVNEFNQTIRPLIYPGGDLYFDVQSSVAVYRCVFFTYYISALSVVTVGMAIFNFTVILVHHACGQIEIINSRLNQLVNSENLDKNSDVAENPVAFIISSHTRLLTFSTYIEKTLKEICLAEVVCATLLICFLAYHSLEEFDKENTDPATLFIYGSLFLMISFNLFLYCQMGETLKNQFQEVGRAAYMIDWYDLPVKTSLQLIMIINMGGKPCQLSAGGMMEISRATFGAVMKTSFAYLNMMRQMA